MKKPYTSNVIFLKFFCALALIIFLTNYSTAQTVNITSPSADIIFTIGTSFTATITENPTSSYTFQTMSYSVDGGAAVPVTVSGTTGTATIPTTGLSYGSHTLVVSATFKKISNNIPKTVTDNLTFLVKPTQPDVTTGSYGFNIPITLKMSNTGIGAAASLTSFPALVYIQSDSLKIGKVCGDKVQFPTGNGGGAAAGTNYDFAFTETGSNTELYYQVDTYDSANGILLAWVQVPALTNTDKTLTFYFGSQSPSHSSAFSASTWPSDYLAVYHFSEGATTATVLDATLHGRNAVQANTTVTNDEIHVAAGIPTTGGAYAFNSTNKSSIIQNTGTYPDITNTFTISAWVTYNGTATADNKLVSDQLNYGHGYKLSVRNSLIETETRTTLNPSPGNVYDADSLVNPSTWTYIQGEFNSTKFINYKNGMFAGTGAFKAGTTGTNAPPEAGNYLTMGLDHGTGAANGGFDDNWFFNGVMDEVRISNIAKSADWVLAEYYNQKNPKLFTVCNTVATNVSNAQTLKAGALICTWKGASGTDLTTAANWDLGAPDLSTGKTSLVIPAVGTGIYPKLAASASIYGLTIADGASLDLNGYTLNVGCNIINKVTTGGKGILDASILLAITSGNSANSTGTINWNGIVMSQIYKSTNNVPNTAELSNMTVSNTNSSPGVVTITGGPVDIYNTLTLTKGNLVIDNTGNGDLTLKSSSILTASVAAIPASYNITGLVNAERYISGGAFKYRGYRFLSSPVYTATAGSNYYFDLKYLSTYAPITGSLGIGGGMSKAGNPTIYLYRGNTEFTNGSYNGGNFRGVNKINNVPLYTVGVDYDGNFNLYVGTGFWFFYRGNTTNINSKYLVNAIPESNVFVSRGTLNQQTVTFVHWYTNAPNLQYTPVAKNPAAYAGYNMVGNPYASSIDWDTFSATTSTAGIYGPKVKKTIYIYNEATKIYGTYDGTIAVNGASHIIPSGQGFYVQAIDATAQLIFHESAKTSAQVTGANLLLSKSPVKSGPVLQYVRLAMSKDSDNVEEAVVRFENTAKDEFVVDEDSQHMTGTGGVNFSSYTSDNRTASINDIPLPKKSQTKIRLYVSATTDGLYAINRTELKNIPKRYEIWLNDAYKNDSLDLKHNATYQFNILRSDTNSWGANRFSLVIRQNKALGLHLLNFAATKTSKGAELTWKTENEENLTNFTIERSTDNGKTFDVVGGFISSSEGSYSLLDKNPPVATDLYRLKLEDLNGVITYSDLISLRYSTLSDNMDNNAVNIYPNPAVGTINVAIVKSSFAVIKSSAPSYSIKITSSTGKVLKIIKTTQDTWQDNVSGLLPGTYVVDVINNNDNTMVGKGKFVKL
ncbi:LamG-like jellyroll fold domain-containing protein [Mucilaginibacter sp.]|uniref:LamG-like jellyroll fold domain-containing protein n=1 Tax=Mucilaginibacter sp. TaxID=1882438 RepID=UPI0026313967|nr:LamG-like jellyroll fold domain-containing protein [Mucilaginibacter sp.]MDB4921550.1 Por secretion system C-terminal sorting protein [Mucilaginibacter sp.]